jgi:hypothetical protein
VSLKGENEKKVGDRKSEEPGGDGTQQEAEHR